MLLGGVGVGLISPREVAGIIMTETIRTPKTPFAPARDYPKPSFWRRLLSAIMAERLRKADEYLADYLQGHLDEGHNELRAAIERRLADRKREADDARINHRA